MAEQAENDNYFTEEELSEKKKDSPESLHRDRARAKFRYEKRIINYSLQCNIDVSSCEGPGNDRRIVVVGKTGAGKSALLNVIHGRQVFKTDCSSNSVTKSTSYATSTHNNRTIMAADTPGIHATAQDRDTVLQQLARVAFMMRNGVHCYIICMSTSNPRLTEENIRMLEDIKIGNNFYDYSLLVYTKADAELNKCRLDDFLARQREHDYFTPILEEIKNRVVAVNNSTTIPIEKQRNREALIAMVDKVVEENRSKGNPEVITNDVSKKANELYTSMTSLVSAYECHPALVDALIETIIKFANRKKIKKNDFSAKVIEILKSEVCEQTNDRVLIFKHDGANIRIPLKKYDSVIQNVYDNIIPEARSFWESLKTCTWS